MGILTTSVATGTVVAGARFPDVELSLIPTLLLEEDRERAAADLIRSRGWNGVTPSDVLAMPSVFIGSTSEIADQMEERRAHYGFSYYIYYIVLDRQLDQVASLVARLMGR